jgi:hypothetical protein
MLFWVPTSSPITDETVTPPGHREAQRLERGVVAQFQFCSVESRQPASEQIEFLTGLTGLPPFPLSLQESDFDRDEIR